jgi:acetyl esterase/lipase
MLRSRAGEVRKDLWCVRALAELAVDFRGVFRQPGTLGSTTIGPVDFRSQDAELRASGKGRPVHDLPDSPESRFLGIRLPDASEDLLRRTNPLTYLGPGLPPFLIQHGCDDDLVPVEPSMLLARALRGVMLETDVRFDVIPGSLHGGPAFETEENMARVFASRLSRASLRLSRSRSGALRPGSPSASRAACTSASSESTTGR